jgi:hypothetical protein
MAKLVGHKLQDSKADGVVRVEARHIHEPAGAVDGKLEVPKLDGVTEDPGHHVDAEGCHRAITWW